MKKRQKPLTYPKDNDKTEQIKELKAIVRRLQKDNRSLKAELKTLEAAFVETQGFLKKQMWEFSVEEVIDAVKKKRRLNAAKNPDILCEKCGAKMDQLTVPRMGTICVCTHCDNRFTLKS
jgi:formylmethanofuran dehydrogenase subunit E